MIPVEAMMAEPCWRCGGRGWYSYDENHGTICEVCCPHDQGWFPCAEGQGNGLGWEACRKGCGEQRQMS